MLAQWVEAVANHARSQKQRGEVFARSFAFAALYSHVCNRSRCVLSYTHTRTHTLRAKAIESIREVHWRATASLSRNPPPLMPSARLNTLGLRPEVPCIEELELIYIEHRCRRLLVNATATDSSLLGDLYRPDAIPTIRSTSK